MSATLTFSGNFNLFSQVLAWISGSRDGETAYDHPFSNDWDGNPKASTPERRGEKKAEKSEE